MLEHFLSDKKLLYIEDDEVTISIMQTLFNRYFNKISVASNGQEGYELFNQNTFDIVIVDLAMPHMNGFEFVTKVRETSDVPIIVTTAYRDETDKVKDIVNTVLFKPVSKKDILKALENLFSK